MKDMNYINDFFDYCRTEKGFSEHTLLAYRYALKDFELFFNELYETNPNFSIIEGDDIKPFLGWLDDKGFSRNSLRQKISAVKAI